MELSRFDEAETYLKVALEAIRKLSGENSVATARAYVDLGDVDQKQERTDEASIQIFKARQIIEGRKPLEPAELAVIDAKLAEIDILESNLAAAKRKKLDKARAELDAAASSGPEIKASVLAHLGWIHILRREPAEGERAYKEALTLYTCTAGERHPAVGRTLHDLAIIYHDLGLFHEADGVYRQAFDILSESLGESNASVAKRSSNMPDC